jgi:hypothetical protein
MWQKVHHMIGKPKPEKSNTPSQDIGELSLGTVVAFTEHAPRELVGMRAQVSAIRTYRFAAETTLTYVVTLTNGARYFISVAYDDEGAYLGIMRELSSAEQRHWFDPDALSFFTEPSTAKTLRCRADMHQEGEWAAERYKKSVDFLVGNVSEGRQSPTEMGRKPRRVEYSMLLDESGERAIEIEVYPEHGNVRLFATRYCPEACVMVLPEDADFDMDTPLPLTDIVQAEGPDATNSEAAIVIPMPGNAAQQEGARHQTSDGGNEGKTEDDHVLDALAEAIQKLNQGVESATPEERAFPVDDEDEPALFADDVSAYLQEKSVSSSPKPDFQRLSEIQQEISNQTVADLREKEVPAGPIPAFLLEPREEPDDLLHEILQPDAMQLRIDSRAAYRMLHRAIKARRPMKEMIRETLGLAPSARDDVIFELPLTQRERQALAIHFQIHPDKHEELEARIVQEITKRLS